MQRSGRCHRPRVSCRRPQPRRYRRRRLRRCPGGQPANRPDGPCPLRTPQSRCPPPTDAPGWLLSGGLRVWRRRLPRLAEPRPDTAALAGVLAKLRPPGGAVRTTWCPPRTWPQGLLGRGRPVRAVFGVATATSAFDQQTLPNCGQVSVRTARVRRRGLLQTAGARCYRNRSPGRRPLVGCSHRHHARPLTRPAAVPVLIVTANYGSAAVEAAREAGADDFLIKPFLPATLLDKAKAILG
jgi:hypothetical protein